MIQISSYRKLIGIFLIISICSCFQTGPLAAQNTATDKRQKKKKLPPPERVLLESKDGVELRADWFAGVDGKETMPIILVHDWDGERRDLKAFAEKVRKELSAAVIVPDLRGHGESTFVKGSEKELDRKRFKKTQMLTMAEDIDSCRRFLQKKNDLGELNLDLLTVVVSGKNCVHAVNWCISDWSWEPIGGIKQGQNVKALVMVSPRKKFKSMSITAGLKTPLFTRRAGALPVLVVWGEDDEISNKDGTTIHDGLKKSRREPTEYESANERNKKQTVYQMVLPTDAVGTDLINEKSNKMLSATKAFFELTVLARKDDYAWQSRSDK